MTNVTHRAPEAEASIVRALQLVIQRRAGQEDLTEPPAESLDNDSANADSYSADSYSVDSYSADEHDEVAQELAGELSSAAPGSDRQAALALALTWVGGDEAGWSWKDLEQMVLTSLPVDHPHWSLWAEQAGLGPQAFMSFIGPGTDGPLTLDQIQARAYTAAAAQRHPDPRVQLHARAAMALHDVLRHTLDLPAEERHADLEAAIREVYGDRPEEIDGVLAQVPEMLFDPNWFLRKFPPGSPAPDFRLQLLHGAETTLADFAGSALLIYFTGSWCGPCQIETPAVVELHAKWSDRGVRFLGVAMEESADGFDEYLAAKGVTWDFSVVDEDHPVLRDYHIEGFPTLIVLGPHGNIVGGMVSAAYERPEVEALLAEGLYQMAHPASISATGSAALTTPVAPNNPAAPTTPAETSATAVVAAHVSEMEPLPDGLVRLDLAVEVDAPWKVYPPGSGEGLPLRLVAGLSSDTELVDWALANTPATGPSEAALTGRFTINATVRPGPQGWQLDLVTQACADGQCQTPRRITLGGAA